MMLSIIIPTHQRTDLLRACLQATTLHAPADSEIIIVDDASPGGIASSMASEFRNVRTIRLDRQRGFAVAANEGIRASQGEIVELLNDDTEVQPGWADAAIPWFHDTSIAAVAPLVLFWPDGQVIDSAGDRYYLGGIAGKRGHRQTVCDEFLRPCRVFGASAAAGFYRRSALDKVGYFAESFASYFEDVDLAFRLQRAGFRAMFEPASRVLHHGSASHGTIARSLLQRQARNEELLFWRNMPNSVLRRALLKHLAVLIGKAIRRWHDGNLTPWFFGKLEALWNAHDIISHRRSLPDWSAEQSLEIASIEECYWGPEGKWEPK